MDNNKTKTKQVAGYFPTLRHFDLSSCKSGKALVYFILSSFEALFLRSQKNRKEKKPFYFILRHCRDSSQPLELYGQNS